MFESCPLLSPASRTTLWKRVHVELSILVPESLLSRGEDEILHAITTIDRGVDVPVARANGIVLLGRIGPLGRRIGNVFGREE